MISYEAAMSKRNLLICFDAFGTLFRPRRPIAQQYGEVARSLGLRGFTDAELEKSFRAGLSCGTVIQCAHPADACLSFQGRVKAASQLWQSHRTWS